MVFHIMYNRSSSIDLCNHFNHCIVAVGLPSGQFSDHRKMFSPLGIRFSHVESKFQFSPCGPGNNSLNCFYRLYSETSSPLYPGIHLKLDIQILTDHFLLLLHQYQNTDHLLSKVSKRLKQRVQPALCFQQFTFIRITC